MADYDIVLLPTFSHVDIWRKREAGKDARGLFSQTVTTFNAWIADLWELHGDGRAIIDSLQRQTIMQAAFDQIAFDQAAFDGTAFDGAASDADGERTAGEDDLTVSPGVVVLASRCARNAAGVPEFEQAVDEAASGRVPEGLVPREAALLQGIARYRVLVSQAEYVEIGAAARYLADNADRVFPRALNVLVAQASPLNWQMSHFFGACEQLSVRVEEAPGASGIGQLREGLALRFGFPSGRYAQPALVADIVRSACAISGRAAADGGMQSGADVLVACADPLALYKEIEPELAREGLHGCVQAQLSFASTDFGRQFLSLSRVLHDDVWAKEDLSCAAVPPFSGFTKAEAIEIDKELRQNRLAERDECLEQLRIASDTFSQLEEIASDPEADVLLGVFEQIAFTSPGRSDEWRIEQLGAASALRSCTSAARRVGASMQAVARVLNDVKITLSFEGVPFAREEEFPAHVGQGERPGDGAGATKPARVIITTQAAAAQMGAASCAHLILCDLTSDDFPIADKDDAASTLFAKLGLLPADTAIARARRTFTALLDLPTEQLTCLRPLNDWDGNPTYPCAMLQEFVDAYRVDAASDEDLDEVFGLPEPLMQGMLQRGEELLFANASAGAVSCVQPSLEHVRRVDVGEVPASDLAKVALARRLPDGGYTSRFCPSPSQVESYLECPFKWFAQSRVRIETFDEGFGALERGSFAHGVLQRFYRSFAEAGHRKVNADNLAQAKDLMRQIADEAQAEERLREPGSGRYVAANQIELREIEACKDQLVSYLDFEASFLPAFAPAYLEFPIGAEDGVEYAGHPFVGTVDRIDVDGRGNAVIVDYKGSVNGAHEIAGKTERDPGKVQTRMYARAVGRMLDLNVVGALYVSYGKKHGCAGAFDSRVIESNHLPAMRLDHCGCALESVAPWTDENEYSQLTFADMLDATEELVGRAIGDMEGGRVQPNPANADVCRYCPVSNCPKRGAN